ncbi:MAG TPA: hypothetical protein VGI85_01640 [Chthoniobacterales bacterium]|jgi:hypothetical protein
MRALFLVSLFAFFALASSNAQSPAPVLMRPVTSAPAAVATSRPASSTGIAADSKETMELLQAMQATNAETIRKQEAALQTLDALQKAAEDIKIFSKRG